MKSGETGFIGNIDSQFNADSSESVFDALFREYERVIFRSLITSFGLDLFIKDQYGGDVDTIHNVRQVGIDPKMQYKNEKNKDDYDNRGSYSHKDVEGAGTNFQQKKAAARTAYHEDNKNTVQDEYEDKPLGFLGKSKNHPTDQSAELDHVLSASSIHNDRGRVLAGISTVDLADAEENLKWTNEHLNKSMNADEIPDYIAKHPELDEDVKKRMMDAYNQAKAAYEKKLTKEYYFNFSNPNCRQFYKDTAKAAQKRGLQMGLRQAFGFLLTELWFSVKDELELCDGTFSESLKAIARGMEKGAEKIKEDYKEIFQMFGEGFISGVISSLTTTLCNVFLTTSENAIRIIRQVWASIVEAVGVLFFNEKDQYLCDRMKSASKVLAAGASVIVGTIVQEKLELSLAKVTIPDELKKIIVSFAGGLTTGMMSVSLLFYIDNDPFDKFLDYAYGSGLRNLKAQAAEFKAYCAKLQGIDVERLNHDAECVFELVNSIGEDTSQDEINIMLKKTMSELGLKSVLGDVSLKDRMKDKDWKLAF